MPLRRLVPRPLRRRLNTLRRLPELRGLAADRQSLVALARLRDAEHVWRSTAPVPVRLTPLDGATIEMRPGSTDAYVVAELFANCAHREPAGSGAFSVVWDLGAYIGATMADFAVRHPRAAVVGVELDPGNAEIAQRNVAAFGDRVRVVRSAVWHTDGEISFDPSPDDLVAGRVDERGGTATAPAMSLNTLLAEHTPGDRVDFVKMDIEGAEAEVLRRNTEWAAHVRAITIEVHPPYTVEECLADLQTLGFEPELQLMPHVGMPAIYGRRPSS